MPMSSYQIYIPTIPLLNSKIIYSGLLVGFTSMDNKTEPTLQSDFPNLAACFY